MVNYKVEIIIRKETEDITNLIGYYETLEYIIDNHKKFIKDAKKQYGAGKYQLKVTDIHTNEPVNINYYINISKR